MTEITKAHVIGKSQNRTALGMMFAYIKMHPNTTLLELKTKLSKQKVCPDTGINELFYTPNEIEQEKLGSKGKWFTEGNACFVSDNEWITLGNGQKIAFNKVWTAKSLVLLQQELGKSNVYGEVGIVPKDNPIGFSIQYQYAHNIVEPQGESQGIPRWIWIVLLLIIMIIAYFIYAKFH